MPVLSDPVITLEEVRLRKVTLSSIDLEVMIQVENRNPLGITLRELPFSVLCSFATTTQPLASGNTGRAKIAAHGSTLLRVPVRSENAALIGALAAFVMKGAVLVTIRGTAVVDAVLFGWSVPFEKIVPVTMEQVADSLAKK